MSKKTKRSSMLIIASSIVFCLGLALVMVAVLNVQQLGWLALGAGLAGLTIMSLAVAAVIANKPEWLMLDFIMSL